MEGLKINQNYLEKEKVHLKWKKKKTKNWKKNADRPEHWPEGRVSRWAWEGEKRERKEGWVPYRKCAVREREQEVDVYESAKPN